MSLRSKHTVKHSCSTPRRELGSKARVSEDGKPPWTAFIVAVDGQVRRRWRDVPTQSAKCDGKIPSVLDTLGTHVFIQRTYERRTASRFGSHAGQVSSSEDLHPLAWKSLFPVSRIIPSCCFRACNNNKLLFVVTTTSKDPRIFRNTRDFSVKVEPASGHRAPRTATRRRHKLQSHLCRCLRLDHAEALTRCHAREESQGRAGVRLKGWRPRPNALRPFHLVTPAVASLHSPLPHAPRHHASPPRIAARPAACSGGAPPLAARAARQPRRRAPAVSPRRRRRT